MSDCKICTAITASTTEECIWQCAEAAPGADLLEIRFDYISEPDVAAILHNAPLPVIATNRPARESGRYQGEESQRLALLQEADQRGAQFVDIELDSLPAFRPAGNARLIVSYHNFERTPNDLEQIHQKIVQTGAAVAKVATMATSIEDSLRMFHLLRDTSHPTIALAMGERGLISRILAPKFGAFLTFASSEPGAESAPGQITSETLRELYRFRAIRPDTAIYGVIGNPVGHSMSPQIHNAAFDALELNRVYVPLLVDDVVSFLTQARELGFHGFSVTIPHKQNCMTVMDEIDPIASRIGAVNTIVNDGCLRGSNTDWLAAIRPIEDKLVAQGAEAAEPLRGRKVVLIGAGGAARAIAFGAIERGAELLIANRTLSRAQALADELGCDSIGLDTIAQCGFEADVLINSSSVGMYPNVEATPIPREHLHPSLIVFDAVYNPIQTRLIREANEVGCVTVNGVEMFVRQAVAQFETWTGRKAPVQRMKQVVLRRLEASQS